MYSTIGRCGQRLGSRQSKSFPLHSSNYDWYWTFSWCFGKFSPTTTTEIISQFSHQLKPNASSFSVQLAHTLLQVVSTQFLFTLTLPLFVLLKVVPEITKWVPIMDQPFTHIWWYYPFLFIVYLFIGSDLLGNTIINLVISLMGRQKSRFDLGWEVWAFPKLIVMFPSKYVFPSL